MDAEDSSIEIFSKIPGRRKQVTALLNLFGADDGEVPCESVFLYGNSGTGKSLVSRALVEYLDLQHSWVNCLEAYSPQVLYRLILKGFKVVDDYRCANFYSFCASLREIASSKLNPSRSIYVVLENADRLFRSDFGAIPSLLRLQEFTRTKICVVILSELTWGKFLFNCALCDPIVIYFPEYTSEELMEILRIHRPGAGCSDEFYDSYVRLLLKIFCPVTRSTREILHMAKLNFAEYRRPVEAGEATEADTVKLWRNIEPRLKTALGKIYLRVLPRACDINEVNAEMDQNLGPSHRSSCELPFYSKFLLVAAYLASYNPPKTDCKFFIKDQGRTKKKKKFSTRAQKQNRHVEGPKSFNLDRLLAIFHSIVEDRAIPSGLLVSQITTLVSLHMLACLTSKETLTNPKYKCLVSLDRIRNVARTVNFDVVRYLEDFV